MKKYHEVEHLRPLEVEVGPSEEDFSFALRLFRSKVQKEKILAEAKKRMRFEKPSVKARRKRREAQNREFLAKRYSADSANKLNKTLSRKEHKEITENKDE